MVDRPPLAVDESDAGIGNHRVSAVGYRDRERCEVLREEYTGAKRKNEPSRHE